MDPAQTRTIGVVTKIDTIQKDSDMSCMGKGPLPDGSNIRDIYMHMLHVNSQTNKSASEETMAAAANLQIATFG